MCGICGFFSKNRITEEVLHEMNDTMYHRGPDADVITDGFTISERDVPDAAKEVSDWIAALDYE